MLLQRAFRSVSRALGRVYYDTTVTYLLVSVDSIRDNNIRDRCQTKTLHHIPKRRPNPGRLVSHTESKNKNTHRTDDSRNDDCRQSEFWFSSTIVCLGHAICNHINELASKEERENGTDKTGYGEEAEATDFPAIRGLGESLTGSELYDDVPEEVSK